MPIRGSEVSAKSAPITRQQPSASPDSRCPLKAPSSSCRSTQQWCARPSVWCSGRLSRLSEIPSHRRKGKKKQTKRTKPAGAVPHKLLRKCLVCNCKLCSCRMWTPPPSPSTTVCVVQEPLFGRDHVQTREQGPWQRYGSTHETGKARLILRWRWCFIRGALGDLHRVLSCHSLS